MGPAPRQGSDTVQRNAIGVVWLIGGLLALGAYVIGPDRFLHGAFGVLIDLQATFGNLHAAFQALLAGLTVEAFELIRALAIGLFVVFVALGLIAARRGLRARVALVTLTVLYLVLLYPALDGYYVSSAHWMGAFLLAAVGALVMTRRLTASAGATPASLRRPDRT